MPSSPLGHVSVSFQNKIYFLWCMRLVSNTIHNATVVVQASPSKSLYSPVLKQGMLRH